MNRKLIIISLSLVALLVAGAFGFVAYRSASAANAAYQIRQAIPGVVPQMDGGRGLRGGGGMGGFGYRQEDLATALGITVEELQTATQKAAEAALKQAVEEGLITQAQADEMAARQGDLPFGGRMFGWLQAKGIDFQAHLAEALGISVSELQAAYQKAAQIALQRAVDEGRITQEQADLMQARQALFSSETFQNAMQEAFKNAVQQAVQAGVITQAQADLILQNMEAQPAMPDGMPGMGGPHGAPHGGFHDGPGGFFPGFPGEQPAPSSSSNNG